LIKLKHSRCTGGHRPQLLMRLALGLCPHAVFLPVDYREYARVSAMIKGVLGRFSSSLEVARQPMAKLVAAFGQAHGRWLYEAARGIDERPLVTHWEPRSMGHETTFQRDVGDWRMLASILHASGVRGGERVVRGGRCRQDRHGVRENPATMRRMRLRQAHRAHPHALGQGSRVFSPSQLQHVPSCGRRVQQCAVDRLIQRTRRLPVEATAGCAGSCAPLPLNASHTGCVPSTRSPLAPVPLRGLLQRDG